MAKDYTKFDKSECSAEKLTEREIGVFNTEKAYICKNIYVH